MAGRYSQPATPQTAEQIEAGRQAGHSVSRRPTGLGAVVWVLTIAGVGTSAYWIVFFVSGAVQVRADPVYIAFERAFPLADEWMAACALLGAIGLWRGRDWGVLYGLLAGASMIFLGLLDVLFNVNEGNYALVTPELWGEVMINVFTLVGGPLVIAYLWTNRAALLDQKRRQAAFPRGER